ncbi:hypothetical protein GCM10025779_20250 [Arthrobacter cryoconiti]
MGSSFTTRDQWALPHCGSALLFAARLYATRLYAARAPTTESLHSAYTGSLSYVLAEAEGRSHGERGDVHERVRHNERHEAPILFVQPAEQ